MFVKRFMLIFVIAALSVLTAMGQSLQAPPKDTKTTEQSKEDAKAKLNAQTYELLDAVIKDIQRLTLPQNRASLSATAGELAWKNDEQAGRALFKDAAADLRAVLAEPLEGEGAPSNRQRVERSQLREKVLFAIARHDSRMALDLLAETRPPSPPKDEAQADSEAELETRLAAIIVANDPAHAIDMARKSLAKGFSYNLPNLLAQIQEKDPAAASELAGDILSKLKTAGLGTNQEAANVAVSIFDMATEPKQSRTKSATKEVRPLLSEQSIRELADLIAAGAIEGASEGGRPIYISSVLSRLEKYAPTRTQQLRRMSSQSGVDIGAGRQSYQEYEKLVETGNAEALIAAAENAEPGLREAYYRQAASKLIIDDKVDEARRVITEHVTNPEQRKQMLAELDKQVLATAAAKGKMEETRKFLSTVSTNEERIAILTQLATALAEKGNKKIALEILEDARGLSPGRTKYSRQLLAKLQIARAYAAIDPSQSLDILESSIDQFNELIGAAIIVGEFLGEEEFVQDDELMLTFVGHMADVFQQQFGKDLAKLATADFARTRSTADKFQRFEIRIMARLLVVQSVLSPAMDETEEGIESKDLTAPVAVSP